MCDVSNLYTWKNTVYKMKSIWGCLEFHSTIAAIWITVTGIGGIPQSIKCFHKVVTWKLKF